MTDKTLCGGGAGEANPALSRPSSPPKGGPRAPLPPSIWGMMALLALLVSSCGAGPDFSAPADIGQEGTSEAETVSDLHAGAEGPPATLATGEYFCISSLITEEIPPPQLAFIVSDGGDWTDITVPSRPLPGTYQYADGVATFYDAEGTVLYYFRWQINSSGREQLAQLVEDGVHTGVFCYRKEDGWSPPSSLGLPTEALGSGAQPGAGLDEAGGEEARVLYDRLPKFPERYHQLDAEAALPIFAEVSSADEALSQAFGLLTRGADCLGSHGPVAIRAYVTKDLTAASGVLVASSHSIHDNDLAASCLSEEVVQSARWAPCADRYFYDQPLDGGGSDRYYFFVVGSQIDECPTLRRWHVDVGPQDF